MTFLSQIPAPSLNQHERTWRKRNDTHIIVSFVLRLFRYKTDIQILHAYPADEKQGKAFEWRSWTSLMLSSSDGQRQDGCLLNMQDKRGINRAQGVFSWKLS